MSQVCPDAQPGHRFVSIVRACVRGEARRARRGKRGEAGEARQERRGKRGRRGEASEARQSRRGKRGEAREASHQKALKRKLRVEIQYQSEARRRASFGYSADPSGVERVGLVQAGRYPLPATQYPITEYHNIRLSKIRRPILASSVLELFKLAATR